MKFGPVPVSFTATRVAAIVLAAGLSSRMGTNKLLVRIDGKPLLRRVAEAALRSSADPVIVVTGNEAETVEATLSGLAVSIVRNPDFRKGLSTSLIRGIDAVPEKCDGAVIMLGDMPGVSPELIDRLIAAFNPEGGWEICVAIYNNKRGNPVLWSKRFFVEIRKLKGDVGAKSLIAENPKLVCEIDASEDGLPIDIDTPEALERFQQKCAALLCPEPRQNKNLERNGDSKKSHSARTAYTNRKQ